MIAMVHLHAVTWVVLGAIVTGLLLPWSCMAVAYKARKRARIVRELETFLRELNETDEQ